MECYKQQKDYYTKINTTKSRFFEEISKIDKSLARTTKEKREKTHINKIINEREVTIDITDMHRIITEYYERLYATTFNNLEEMDKCLEICNISRPNHEELENLNELINSEETEKTIKNLPKCKSLGPDGFTSKFYQPLKKKLMPILIKLFQNIRDGAINLPNTFCEVNRTLIPKPVKGKTRKKEENRQISVMSTDVKILR